MQIKIFNLHVLLIYHYAFYVDMSTYLILSASNCLLADNAIGIIKSAFVPFRASTMHK